MIWEVFGSHMFRVFPKLFAFTSALAFGLLISAGFDKRPNSPDSSLEDAILEKSASTNFTAPEKSENRVDEGFVAEFHDLPDDEMLDFPEFPTNFIDIYNTQGLLRRTEVVGKTGQEWLVMAETNGQYVIKSATASVRQLKTISYPGDENDAKISFGLSGTSLFAFRGIKNVHAGPVTTVYLRPTWDEIDRRNLPIEPMKTGFKRELNLKENWYMLRVSYARTKNGEQKGVLVLENNGIQQIVARNSFELAYGATIGDLLWAGDIDGDGKLDLYFDEFNEKGYFSGGLYLSSHASEDELVKLAAVFGYAGC